LVDLAAVEQNATALAREIITERPQDGKPVLTGCSARFCLLASRRKAGRRALIPKCVGDFTAEAYGDGSFARFYGRGRLGDWEALALHRVERCLISKIFPIRTGFCEE
jgi:hypothetical protein